MNWGSRGCACVGGGATENKKKTGSNEVKKKKTVVGGGDRPSVFPQNETLFFSFAQPQQNTSERIF